MARPSRLMFAPDSIFNTDVSALSTLDVNSTAVCDYLRHTVALYNTNGLGSGAGNGIPRYVVPAGQPRVPVGLLNPKIGAFQKQALSDRLAQGVPIPAGAQPQTGNLDADLAVYSPDTDELWELFQAGVDAEGNWSCSWGGYKQHVSADPGYYRHVKNAAGVNVELPWWGVTACSVSLLAGVVLIEELEAGEIPHALAMVVRYARAGWHSFPPAQRQDGRDFAQFSIPEGAHFRLDPALDLDSLSLNAVCRAYAQAAQRYGIVVNDQTGQGVTFRCEKYLGSGTSPYASIFANHPLQDFPLEHLQLLPMDLVQGYDKTLAAA